MNIYARLALVVVIVLAIAGAWRKFDSMLGAADKAGYQRRAGEDQAAADAQADRNRELGRLAELHLDAIAQKQATFLATAAKEIHDAAAPLAACPIPEPVRVRLNAAASCARGDSAAGCEPDKPVPVAR